jgi:hypothetical protein
MDSVLETLPRFVGQAATPAAEELRVAQLGVFALFQRAPFDMNGFQVELRHGELLHHPPAAVLWRNEVPLALLLNDMVAVNRTTPRLIRERVLGEATIQGFAREQVRERRLWQLLPHPRR